MRLESFIGTLADAWQTGKFTKAGRAVMRDTDSRFILMEGGFRSSKTFTLASKLIQHNLMFPQARTALFRHHLASLKKSSMRTALGLIKPEWLSDVSTTDLTVTFRNGSQLTFMAAEQPDRLGSIELTMAGLDEMTEFSVESIQMIAGRLSGKLTVIDEQFASSPALAAFAIRASKTRQMIGAVNPKAKNHFVYRDFHSEPKPGYKAYQFATFDNVNLPATYLISAMSSFVKEGYDSQFVERMVHGVLAGEIKSNDPELVNSLTTFARRNLLGEWITNSGAVHDSEVIQDAVVSSKPLEPVTARYLSIDHGYNNPRVIAYEQYLSGLIVAVDYWTGSEIDQVQFAKVIKEFSDRYSIDRLYAPGDDPGANRLIKQEIGNSKVKRARTAVLSGIAAVNLRMESGKLKFLDKPGDKAFNTFMDEMIGFHWQVTRSGVQLDAPVKEADHFPDALRYLIYSLDYRLTAGEVAGDGEPQKTENYHGLILPVNRGISEQFD